MQGATGDESSRAPTKSLGSPGSPGSPDNEHQPHTARRESHYLAPHYRARASLVCLGETKKQELDTDRDCLVTDVRSRSRQQPPRKTTTLTPFFRRCLLFPPSSSSLLPEQSLSHPINYHPHLQQNHPVCLDEKLLQFPSFSISNIPLLHPSTCFISTSTHLQPQWLTPPTVRPPWTP